MKTQLRWIKICLILALQTFFSDYVYSQSETLQNQISETQTDSNEANNAEDSYLYFPASTLVSQIPEDFLGALFVCQPYCKVISHRLRGDWSPELSKIKISATQIQLIDIEDPLYPLLFPEKAKEVATIKEIIQKEDDELNFLGALGIRKAKFAKGKLSFKTPKTAFVNGLRVSTTLQHNLISFETNSNVQSEFKPQSGINQLNLGLAYMRGKPVRLFSRWIQFQAEYQMGLYSTETVFENEAKLTNSITGYNFIFWDKTLTAAYGLKYSSVKDEYKVDVNNINTFSFSENATFIGLAYRAGRWYFDFDYNLELKLEEKQPFRDQLESASLYKTQLMYCQTRKRVFSKVFTPCYHSQFIYSTSRAGFNPIYNPTDSVEFKRQNIILGLTLHFGEDFLR